MAGSLALERFLPYRISRLAERVSRSLSLVYAERFAISVPEWRVLATLAESPGLTASAVTGLTNLDKVKVSRAVTELCDRGLLLRQTSRSDRRSSELRLSAAGERLFSRIAPLAAAWEAELLRVLSPAEQEQLFALLSRLEQQLPVTLDVAVTNTSPKARPALAKKRLEVSR